MKILTKQPNKDFTVLNLSDPQLSNEEWQDGHKNRKILESTIAELIRRVEPDLITISGDLSWAGYDHAYDMLAQFINSFEIPWAHVWGNHDNQKGSEYIQELVSRYSAYSHCIYECGDPALGNGNYIILIEENGSPVEALIMMDTHDREPYVNAEGETKKAWARLTKPQICWYNEQLRLLKAKGCKDATLILHIPIYAYRHASNAAFKPNLDLKAITVAESPGNSCWNEGYTDSTGVQYEKISNYPEDDGVFDAIQESGITRHVLAGHDHVNNWIIRYEGVCLAYALKTGPGCYWNTSLNGGTVLKINENGVYDLHHEYVDVSTIK